VYLDQRKLLAMLAGFILVGIVTCVWAVEPQEARPPWPPPPVAPPPLTNSVVKQASNIIQTKGTTTQTPKTETAEPPLPSFPDLSSPSGPTQDPMPKAADKKPIITDAPVPAPTPSHKDGKPPAPLREQDLGPSLPATSEKEAEPAPSKKTTPAPSVSAPAPTRISPGPSNVEDSQRVGRTVPTSTPDFPDIDTRPPVLIRRSRPVNSTGTVISQSVFSTDTNASSQIQSALPVLVWEKKGPPAVYLGQTARFAIAVRNIGSVPARQIHVEDEIPEGLRFLGGDPQPILLPNRVVWNLDLLEPGAKRILQVELQPMSEGEIIHRTGVGMTGVLRTRVSPPLINVAILGPSQVALGGKATFKIKITNAAREQLSGLMLSVKFAQGLAHPKNPGEHEIEIAEAFSLSAGATKEIDLTLDAVRPGRQIIEARVARPGQPETISRGEVLVGPPGSAGTKASGTEKAAYRALARSTMTIVGRDQVLEAGRETVYEIRVVNGGLAADSDVKVRVTLPMGMTLRYARGPTAYHTSGSEVVFDPMPRLDSQSEVKYQITVMAQQVGDQRVHAQLTTRQLQSPITKEARTEVYKD
jgi:uncharacterized repeat protein (TIGR01451 family)